MTNLQDLAQRKVSESNALKRKEAEDFKNNYVYEVIKRKMVAIFGDEVLDTIIKEGLEEITTRVNEFITAKFSLSLSACNWASALSGHKYLVDTKAEADKAFLQFYYSCSKCDFSNILNDVTISSASDFHRVISRVIDEGCEWKIENGQQTVHGRTLSSMQRRWREEDGKCRCNLKTCDECKGDV